MLALGGRIKHQFTDITPTFLTLGVLDTVREADYIAGKVLADSGKIFNIACVFPFAHLDQCVSSGVDILCRLFNDDSSIMHFNLV